MYTEEEDENLQLRLKLRCSIESNYSTADCRFTKSRLTINRHYQQSTISTPPGCMHNFQPTQLKSTDQPTNNSVYVSLSVYVYVHVCEAGTDGDAVTGEIAAEVEGYLPTQTPLACMVAAWGSFMSHVTTTAAIGGGGGRDGMW